MDRYRLPQRDGEVIDRSKPLSFTWNGRPYSGFEGDTIASALAGSGVDVFSRGMKYHRRRGILTADHWDPNLLVQVGDEPNVRAGHRRLSNGIAVSAQNVWPSLRFDLGSINQVVGRFLSAGFYYKTFMRPRFLWPLYQKVLSRFAPGGRIHWESSTHGAYDKRYAHPDVLVAGGGPSGMAAALAAAEAGADVLLVEHEYQLGGHLLWGGPADQGEAANLVTAVEAHPGIEVLRNSTVTGRYDHNWVSVLERSHATAPERLIRARAGSLVVAPGLVERPYVFAGNDTPGVMLSGAVRRLINLWAVKPGRRAVVLSANTQGDSTLDDLRVAGVEIVASLDARVGEDIVSVEGRGRARKVTLGDGRTVKADLVVTATGWTAPTSLLNMAEDRPVYDPVAARYFPDSLPDDVLATGGIVGDGSTRELVEHGNSTGQLAANRALRLRHNRRAMLARAADPEGPAPEPFPDTREPLSRAPHPECYRSSTHGMVDLSEDVSSKDLLQAAAEGFDSIELMKRYTTVTMGSSQGKLETVNAAAILAEGRNMALSDVGTTVWRPPFSPVTLGALAGRIHEPVRRSALQNWHEAHGASPLLAGAWVRPDHYGDPEGEAANVRANVGLIDVTPLGKLDLRGSDVPKLLELVYVNKWQKLEVGRVRYGTMVGIHEKYSSIVSADALRLTPGVEVDADGAERPGLERRALQPNGQEGVVLALWPDGPEGRVGRAHVGAERRGRLERRRQDQRVVLFAEERVHIPHVGRVEEHLQHPVAAQPGADLVEGRRVVDEVGRRVRVRSRVRRQGDRRGVACASVGHGHDPRSGERGVTRPDRRLLGDEAGDVDDLAHGDESIAGRVA